MSLPGARSDAAWTARIDAHHTAARDLLAQALAAIGGPPIGILITLAVAAAVVRWRRRRAGVTVLAAALLSECDVLLLKLVSERPSPTGGLYLGVLGGAGFDTAAGVGAQLRRAAGRQPATRPTSSRPAAARGAARAAAGINKVGL